MHRWGKEGLRQADKDGWRDRDWGRPYSEMYKYSRDYREEIIVYFCPYLNLNLMRSLLTEILLSLLNLAILLMKFLSGLKRCLLLRPAVAAASVPSAQSCISGPGAAGSCCSTGGDACIDDGNDEMSDNVEWKDSCVDDNVVGVSGEVVDERREDDNKVEGDGVGGEDGKE